MCRRWFEKSPLSLSGVENTDGQGFGGIVPGDLADLDGIYPSSNTVCVVIGLKGQKHACFRLLWHRQTSSLTTVLPPRLKFTGRSLRGRTPWRGKENTSLRIRAGGVHHRDLLTGGGLPPR